MVTDELNDGLKTEIGSFLESQAKAMLSAQLGVSKSVYSERTGTLNRALSSNSYNLDLFGMSIDVNVPLHIRFLDMKRASIKTTMENETHIQNRSSRYHGRNREKVIKAVAKGKKKSVYAPIYNRYVYGYLKSAIWKKLKRAVPAHLIQEWRNTVGEGFNSNFTR